MSGTIDPQSEPDATTRPAKRAWYTLAILVLIYIMGSVDRAVPSVVVEPLKREFGLSDGQIGLLSGFAYSVPYALAALPSGWIIDRFSRRNFLALMVALWSGLTMMGAGATSYMTLLLARMGVGATEASASPGSLSMIGDMFPRRRRGTAVSLYYAGTAAGQLVTFLFGGWLLMHFGWRALFLIAGVPGLLLAALLLFTCREPKRGQFDPPFEVRPEDVGKRFPYADAFGYILRSAALRHGIWANLLATGVQFSVMVWTVSFLMRVHGLSNEYAAIWVGIGIGLFQTAASLAIGPFADRYARGEVARLARVPMLFASCAGVAGIAMTMAPTVELAIIFMALMAAMAGAFNGPGYAVLLSLSPARMRGSILSVAKLCSILIGTGVLTYFTGTLSDVLGSADSIRYALGATFLFHFWAAFHYWMASRAASRVTPEA